MEFLKEVIYILSKHIYYKNIFEVLKLIYKDNLL